jgi:hypothetical protein
MRIAFSHCDLADAVTLGDSSGARGFLTCPCCGRYVCEVDVSGCRDWIDRQVQYKRHLLRTGRLGTRKQSRRQSDEDIDLDGLAAELAACAILCPGHFESWRKAAERGKGNRGRDLVGRWTGLDKPVEVKQTRYHDEHRGFLLVRPPRCTPGDMRPEYIDAAYYVLLHGSPYRYTLSGWIDREGLVHDGQLNPVPVGRRQRQCWGIHWTKLRPLEDLAARCRSGPPASWLSTAISGCAARLWQLLSSRLFGGAGGNSVP